jgi:hypothetical protein
MLSDACLSPLRFVLGLFLDAESVIDQQSFYDANNQSFGL